MGTHYLQAESGGTHGVYHGREKKTAARFASRCRIAAKREKFRILDEYPALSGSKSRKYAIFKLNRLGTTRLLTLDGQTLKLSAVEKIRKKRAGQPHYAAEVALMLELLWKNFNRLCGKLFAPFLRQNLDFIRLRKKYRMSDAVAAKLKTISPRTIDRLLQKPKRRMKSRGTSGTRPVRLLHRAIPILAWLHYVQNPQAASKSTWPGMTGDNPSGWLENRGNWKDPSSLIRHRCKRTAGGERRVIDHYYISDMTETAEKFGGMIRGYR